MSRVEALRGLFDAHEIDAFLVPKNDEYMGEYIRPCDERLAWISGFTGSAGFAIITRHRAALFVDGRYIIQAPAQAPDFEVVHFPQSDIPDWLGDERLGFDPDLIGVKRAEKFAGELGGNWVETSNLIDQIWEDRPKPQPYDLAPLPIELAGQESAEKIGNIIAGLKAANVDGFISNNPESIAWLLNIRGGEIPTLPAPMGYLFLDTDGRLDIFGINAPDFDLPANFHNLDALNSHIENFDGRLGYNAALLPFGRFQKIQNPKAITDPIIAQKAQKNPAEIKASRNAHDLDGLAMIKFLHWIDEQDPTTLDEIKAANRLRAFRAKSDQFLTDSFGSISAFDANAANAHYQATSGNFTQFQKHGLYLIDSGGHYPGATTDITRTIAIGTGLDEARAPFTQVLNGLAAISTLKFPKGSLGRDIDPIARASLWRNKRNYGHGTGHGVGAALSVHEGPASISPRGDVALEKGMILSLEPGFYLEGEYGIRLENLALVIGDDDYYGFESLSFVPIDQRMVLVEMLEGTARHWLNKYHKKTVEKHADFLDESCKNWLISSTNPI